ncbi:EthD domain-containing protein [Burkholderia gladioli]|uniref:EthD domain-containing protein n=1 Tax=Burkholderia gladioli TaxID=28095 RepID=UPI0016402A24|nr:EthD domain-containing protein [Burkholderia gladioli]
MTLKLNIIGRRRPGTTLAEHLHYIRKIHGEAVLKYIHEDPHNAPTKYVQNAVVDGRYRQSQIDTDPFTLNRDFVTQIWVNDFPALERSRSTEFYKTRLKDDEDQFVDQENVVFLPCIEHVVAPGGSLAEAAWKVFVLFRRAPDANPAEFMQAWRSTARLAGDLAPRHVQNEVLHLPDRPAPTVDAMDEFWLPNETAAYSTLDAWTSRIERDLIAPRLALAASIVSLLAREDVVHGGTDGDSRAGGV